MDKQRPRLFLAFLGIQIILQNRTAPQVSPRAPIPRPGKDSLPTKPATLIPIPLSERHRPHRRHGKRDIERAERPAKGILVPATEAEPEFMVGLHVGGEVERGEVEALVAGLYDTRIISESEGMGRVRAYLVDDDLTGFKRPVIKVALVPDNPPYRIIHMILGQVGPKRRPGPVLTVRRRLE